MEFVLHYRGPLRPNGNASHKHDIRKHFHPQLKSMWAEPPLSDYRDLLQVPGDETLIRQVGSFTFAPRISRNANLLAETEIMLLRPHPAGSIVHNGDIDNRLKTLFDAMRVPSQSQELPPGIQPEAGENPFFCVLDDDRLITKVAITTERLWEPVASPDEVELTVLIKTKQGPNPVNILGLDSL